MGKRWRPKNEGQGPFSKLNLTMAKISTTIAKESMSMVTNNYIPPPPPKPIYIKVLFPVLVVNGDFCRGENVCSFFDNEGGHPSCDLNIGELHYDKDGYCPKPKKCLELKEV